MRRLYIDLDGVVADFEAQYEKYFGKKYGSVTDEQWKEIHKIENFFLEIPVFRQAKTFMASISRYNPTFLTAAPRSNFEHVARQKLGWRDRHFPEIYLIPVFGGKNKGLYMHSTGDVLVDDTPIVCQAWESYGGTSILHTGDFEETLDKVYIKMRERN